MDAHICKKHLKTYLILFEKKALRLVEFYCQHQIKIRVELWGTETFSKQSKTQTSCDMAVMDTNQWRYMEKA